jgi:hypothetical protein
LGGGDASKGGNDAPSLVNIVDVQTRLAHVADSLLHRYAFVVAQKLTATLIAHPFVRVVRLFAAFAFADDQFSTFDFESIGILWRRCAAAHGDVSRRRARVRLWRVQFLFLDSLSVLNNVTTT